MPGVIGNQGVSSRFNGLRYPHKRITAALWATVALLILFTIFSGRFDASLAERAIRDVDDDYGTEDIFEDDDFEKDESDSALYSSHQQRINWLRQMQEGYDSPPPIVKLIVYHVCSSTCHHINSSHILNGTLAADVKQIEMNPTLVSLDEPPIPIIGTDDSHRRVVSARDVAEFMAHLKVWRAVFHGHGSAGVFLSCRVSNPVPVLTAMRKDSWFRNETDGGTMGKEKWDILLLGAGRNTNVPSGSVDSRAISSKSIGEEDLLGYAVSKRGANRLLSHAKAYTVHTRSFVSVLHQRKMNVLRWDGAGLGEVDACQGETGEKRESTTLPFYPPVHWVHAAARGIR